MPGEKVLVVEDEEDIQELIRYNLAREAYQVTCVTRGEEAIKKAQSKASIWPWSTGCCPK